MGRGVRLGFVFVLVACALVAASSIPGPSDRTLTSCEGVREIFEMKNITTELPRHPIDGAELAVCEATHSCCTREMETNLRHLVRNDFQALLHHNSRSLEGLLATTATRLQDHVAELTKQSENKTEALFHQVYHRIAPFSRPAVKKLYADLSAYLDQPLPNGTVTNPNAEINLEDTVKNFFTDLFPLIYHHAVNPHLRDFHEDYKSCLRAAMPEIQPFGGVPRQLSLTVSKTMEATRVLLQALSIGAEVLNSTDMLLNGGGSESHECHTALLRMSYCSRCQGLVRHVKPCAGYCLNVLRGCLTQHAAELDLPWNGFVEATERLVVAVKGHEQRGVVLNVEQVLATLDSRILDSIMFAMENGPELEKKVKRTCGHAQWVAEVDGHHQHHHPAAEEPTGQVAGVTLTQGHISTGQGHGGERHDDSLSTQLHHFLASLTKSRGFYANLAESLCSDESFAETRDTADCWNGKRVGEYTKTVVAASVTAQKYNPELTWTQRSPDARIAQLSDKLRHIRQVVLSQLTTAPESDSYMQEGSGSGHTGDDTWPGADIDDDDRAEWADGSGSGVGEIGHKNDGIDPHINKVDSNENRGSSPTKGTSRTTSRSSLLRAPLALTACLAALTLSLALRDG